MRRHVKWTIFLQLVIMSFGTFIYATSQFPDILIYNNEKLALTVNPLEPFLEKAGIRPRAFFPIRNEKDKNSFVTSTACWRGYIAVFDISGDRLYLKEIEECHGDRKAELKRMFKEKFQNGRVFASWYTGTLRCPRGKMTKYVHMGYMSEFERELVIDIENGEVQAVDEFKNPPIEIPDGYKMINFISFKAVLPGILEECDPGKRSSESENRYCLESEDRSLSLKGRHWLEEDKLYGEERYKWIKKELAAKKREKELFSFGDPRLSKSRWGHMGWIEGKSENGDSRICLFVMSNINSRLRIIISARSVPEEKFREMVQVFSNSIKIIEFGY